MRRGIKSHRAASLCAGKTIGNAAYRYKLWMKILRSAQWDVGQADDKKDMFNE
jgi:hypothetical protein